MFDILGFRLSFWVILSFSCNDLCQWAVQLDIPEVMDAGTVLRRSLVTVLTMWLSHKFTGIPGPTRQFPLAILLSLSIKLELLGLLELRLTTLENGFLLSKWKESTPYSHYNEERNKLITLPRSLPLEETTLRTPRNWTTPSQRNLSFSSSLLQVIFCQVANSKSHKGLSHIMKVRRCQ